MKVPELTKPAGAVVSPVYAQVAERVLAYAMAVGYDENDGGCAMRAFPDGSKLNIGGIAEMTRYALREGLSSLDTPCRAAVR